MFNSVYVIVLFKVLIVQLGVLAERPAVVAGEFPAFAVRPLAERQALTYHPLVERPLVEHPALTYHPLAAYPAFA